MAATVGKEGVRLVSAGEEGGAGGGAGGTEGGIEEVAGGTWAAGAGGLVVGGAGVAGVILWLVGNVSSVEPWYSNPHILAATTSGLWQVDSRLLSIGQIGACTAV